jgi:hypothetical protein
MRPRYGRSHHGWEHTNPQSGFVVRRPHSQAGGGAREIHPSRQLAGPSRHDPCYQLRLIRQAPIEDTGLRGMRKARVK